jgi:hypothetical protein
VGYIPALQVALAREDRVTAERAAAGLERLSRAAAKHRLEWLPALVEASLRDNPAPLLAVERSFADLDQSRLLDTTPVIMFLGERGLRLPPTLLDRLVDDPRVRYIDYLHQCTQVASALAAGDDSRLAAAIDTADAHGLIPHAARMRIVLALRTSDASLLARARPVLEGLGDRLFLRRLEEARAALQ